MLLLLLEQGLGADLGSALATRNMRGMVLLVLVLVLVLLVLICLMRINRTGCGSGRRTHHELMSAVRGIEKRANSSE